MTVVVFSDWDMDGAVSAAEILYSQNILGMYPVNKKCDVILIPTSVRSIHRDVESISDIATDYIVILDVAYSKSMDKTLGILKSRGAEILYIDHHISTAIHADKIMSHTRNLVVGKVATAVLVYNLLRSHGLDVAERLKAFIEAVSIIEKGGRLSLKPIDKKLVDIVATISRTLVRSRNRELWIRTIRWLTEPLPRISIPFSTDVKQFINTARNDLKELKALANELALGAVRVFNMRFIDIRSRDYPYKSTSIASALYRLLKKPILLLARTRYKQDVLIIKSEGTIAYDLAIHLYRAGIVEDVAGHQTLTISLLKPNMDKEVLLQKIREIIATGGPAGI